VMIWLGIAGFIVNCVGVAISIYTKLYPRERRVASRDQ
jgi:hypothetical protein